MLSTRERFDKHVEVTSTCWLWTGGIKAAGYGTFHVQVDGRWTTTPAHRWAYLDAGLVVPAGFEVDHLCNVPACVRLEHLEAVTPAENRRRRDEARTHCTRGHDLAVVGFARNGRWRTCSACLRLRRPLKRAVAA